MDLPLRNLSATKISVRKYKAIDTDAFKEDLRASSLCNNFSDDLDTLTEDYNRVLQKLVDKHAPLITKSMPLRNRVPWYTDAVHVEKCKRRQLERKWRFTGLAVHRQLYKEQRQVVRHVLKAEKRKYYVEKVMDCGSDQKALFAIVNNLLHKEKTSVLPHHTSLLDLVENFSSFFKKKIDNISTKLDDLLTTVPRLPESDTMNSSDIAVLREFAPATEAEVLKVITSSPKKTCQLDPMLTQALVDHVPVLLPYITHTINSSLSTGCVPAAMKTALVTPLIKKPSLEPDDLKNYRPVSGLSFLSKVLERVVSSRLKDHLMENELLEPRQSAYRANHSTETALLKVHSDLLMAVDDGGAAFLVLLDLSAAFDLIDHRILLTRLHTNFCISDTALAWISSYLSERVQRVHVNGASSTQQELRLGVPQGSVLGPLLFSLYTTPLSEIADRHGVSIHFYADDTQVYLSSSVNKSDVEKKLSCLEDCIADIRVWMLNNRLMLNDSKTEFLVIVSPRQEGKLHVAGLNIGGCTIKPTQEARNLGVIFDKNLNMQAQIANICRVSYLHLRNIGQLRKVLDQESTEKLIHAFLTSRLDNANSLLYGLPQVSIDKLQRILNIAARVVTLTKKFSHITPILRDLHWLPVTQRIKYKILLLTYKALHGMAPSYMEDFVHTYVPGASVTLRSQDSGLLAPFKTRLSTYGDRAFPAAAPVLWKQLPKNVRDSATIDEFKKKLKTNLFNKAFPH